MKGKILLVVGLGVGYVLGTRAGRERYEELKAAVQRFWRDPRVQRRVDEAEDFVKDKAPEVAEFLADGAKKVVGAVAGTKSSTSDTAAKSSTASTSGRQSTSTKRGTTKPAASK